MKRGPPKRRRRGPSAWLEPITASKAFFGSSERVTELRLHVSSEEALRAVWRELEPHVRAVELRREGNDLVIRDRFGRFLTSERRAVIGEAVDEAMRITGVVAETWP